MRNQDLHINSADRLRDSQHRPKCEGLRRKHKDQDLAGQWSKGAAHWQQWACAVWDDTCKHHWEECNNKDQKYWPLKPEGQGHPNEQLEETYGNLRLSFQSTSKLHKRMAAKTANTRNSSVRFVVRRWPWWIGPDHSCESSCIQKQAIDVRDCLDIRTARQSLEINRSVFPTFNNLWGWSVMEVIYFILYSCNDWLWLKRCRHMLLMW